MCATYFQMTEQKKKKNLNTYTHMYVWTHTRRDPDRPTCYLLILGGQFMGINILMFNFFICLKKTQNKKEQNFVFNVQHLQYLVLE